jgi:hypothetical protein
VALVLAACGRATQKAVGATGASPRPAADDSRAVALDGLRNHDLFGAGALAYRVTEARAWSGPVGLDFDAAAAPDAVVLRSLAMPDAPADVRVPIGRTARTLYVLTGGYGGLDVRDIVADGVVEYADGRTQPIKWMVGEHAWPAWAGATGRDADAVPIGWNPHGDVLTASLRTVPIAFPTASIAALVLRSRPGPLTFALLEVRASDAEPRTQGAWPTREQDDDFYAFDVRRPPQALPVSGPLDGALRVDGGRLVRPDGRPARLWGVNLVGRGALPPVGQAEAWAVHVAAMGFDLARLHHIDAQDVGLVDPHRGELLADGSRVPALRPEGLARLDAFVDALAAAGVRVLLEGWTLRAYRPEEGVPDPEGLPLNNKLAAFFRPEWEEARKAWFRALWGRTDPATGRSRAAGDVVAAVEIANEDSLVASWHSGALERLGRAHRAVLDARWNAWLRGRYGTDAALASAWNSGPRAGLQPGEALALESVAREPSARGRADLWPHARSADLLRFYTELEREHYRRMVAFLREELGVRAPIVCTSSFGVPAADATVDPCDAADLHVYWDPPAEQLVFTDQSLLAHPLTARTLERASACRDGRPCFVSEFDHTWPGRHGQEAPLTWAAFGARQGWDAMAWFAWSHDTLDLTADPAGSHDLQGRENALAQLPAARFLFVSGEVPEASRRFTRWWSPPALLRDLAEAGALWLDPQVGPTSLVDTRLRQSFDALPPDTPAMPAPSGGPVRWDVAEGRLTVATERLWAVVGAPRGVAGGLSVDVAGAPSVSLLSLDGTPLAEGARALLTVVERASAEGSVWGSGPSLLAWGRGPVRLARVHGTVTLAYPRGTRAWALDGDGRRVRPLALRRGRGGVELATTDLRTPWVEVEVRRRGSLR